MAIRYSLYDTPNPDKEEEKGLPHARAVSYQTKRLDDICAEITERTALSSADVKGVLDSFAYVMHTTLSRGDHVELEDLGFFSPSLKTTYNEKGKAHVEVDGINFRCSKKLKEKLSDIKLVKEKREPSQHDLDARRSILTRYLQANGHISKRSYAAITGCSRYRADLDIALFESEGLICRTGYRNQGIYVLAK